MPVSMVISNRAVSNFVTFLEFFYSVFNIIAQESIEILWHVVCLTATAKSNKSAWTNMSLV